MPPFIKETLIYNKIIPEIYLKYNKLYLTNIIFLIIIVLKER